MSVRKTALAAALALFGLAATADRASAQFYNYNYAVTPYGGYYNTYSVAPAYSVGYTPYGFGISSYPTYSYSTNFYRTPYYGGFTSPYYAGYRGVYGPRVGYGYRGWR